MSDQTSVRMSARDVSDLVLAAAIWGASFMFQRVAVPDFGPFPLAFLRVAIAAVLLMSLQIARGSGAETITRWRTLLFLGVINTALPFWCFAYATQHVPAGIAAVLNGTSPLFAAAIGVVVFRERLDSRRLAGLLGGFAGVVLLVSPDLRATYHLLSVSACLIAAACYGIGAHTIRRRLAGVPAASVAAGSQVYAALSLAVPAALTWPGANPSIAAWGSAITVGAVCTGVAYAVFFRLIQSIGATRAIMVTYLIPVFGMAWGSVVLSEPITPSMVAGCIMIIAGVATTSRAPTVAVAQRT